MKLRTIKYCSILYFSIFASFAFAEKDIEPSPWVKAKVVILKSTKSYAEALSTAKDASKKLKQKLNLRELVEDKSIGLTYPKEKCPVDTYPCYYSRERYLKTGNYISIEYSSGFKGFTPKYYIVVAGMYPKGDKENRSILSAAKKIYTDAYAKETEVYLGCMH